MRRYSLLIFLFIFLINISVLVYQEKFFEEKASTSVSSTFRVENVEVKDNYTMFYADKVAILL